MTRQEYENLTLSNLKEIAKELGVKNISKFKKNELIDEIIRVSPNSIEKDGVVLRENISPKNNISAEKVINENDNKQNNVRPNINRNNDVQRNTDNNSNINNSYQKAEKKEMLKEMINESNIAKGIFLDLNMVSNSHSFRNIVFNELFEGRVHNAIFSNRKLLSKLSDFYQSYLLMAAGVIDESKLSYYIKTFPSNFIKDNIKEKYPENKLIQSISYTVDKRTRRVSLELKTTGMTTAEKEKLSSAWVDLYKKDKNLALELFEYNFFRGGIAFSPKTFMGLLPTYIKDRIEGYYEAYSLNPMVDENIVMDQFIRNNWPNNTLVPYKSIKKNNGRFGSDGTITFFTEEALKDMDGIIYFKTSTRDSVSLYKLKSRNKTSAVYVPIESLGGNGEYLEISTENIERRAHKIDSSTETPQSEETDSTEIEDQMPDEDGLESKEKEFRDLMYKAITASRDIVSAENYRRNYKNFSESDKKLYEKGMKKYLNDELSKQGYELNEEEINEIYKQFCK